MIHTPGESFEARESAAVVSVEPDTAAVTIPDAHLLFTADFKRKGSDLVLTGDDGHKILVPDYFRHEKQPDLVSPEGALLSASLVELLSGSATPGQYAQAAAPAAQQPIGRVETVGGSATVTRNGVAVDLNVGDLVFQGDVVQTRSDSTLGIGFADGSAFSLKENARMALNEFVYDPNSTSNSALINLVQGTVSFIASQVAKTGNMRVDTPTATLGIRGTFVTVDVSSVDGHTVASLGLETNLTTGEQFAGSFTLTNRITNNQVMVSQVASMFSVSPAGTISESAKPAAIAAIEQASFQALSAIAAATAASMGTAPTAPNQFLNDPNSPSGPKAGDTGPSNSPAPGGSGGASPAPTNTSPTDNTPTKITFTTTTTTVDTPPANTGGPTNTPPANTGAPVNTPNNTNPNNQNNANPAANPPANVKPTAAATDATDTEAATPQPGSFNINAHVSINDPDDTPTGYVIGSATLVSATVPAGLPSTLTDPAFLLGLLAIGPDGTVSYDKSNFAFLGAGQSLTYTIGFDVKSGPDTVHLTLTFTVNGTNEAPTITIGAGDAAAATITDDTHSTVLLAHGTLSFKDPDVTDQHSISVAVKSGHTIGAFLGGVLIDTTGSDSRVAGVAGDIGWTFAANKAYVQSLAVGETDTEVFTITLHDGNGGTVSQDVPITVVGVNDGPTVTNAGATGSLSERANTTNDTADKDQASGTIAFADPDLSDTHTVTQGAPTFTWSGGSLTPAQQAALTAASTLTLVKTDSTGTGSGLVAWTDKITDSALDFVAAGETLTATYNVTINDGHGGTVTQPVTVTATGANDVPVINGGPIIASVQEDGGTATRATGLLTATDPDLTDTQTWSIVDASATHAPNYQFKIDEFKVVKTGTNSFTFDDQFNDGSPPPSVPSGSGLIPSYFVTGTVLEQDGKAVLNGTTAGFGTGSPLGDPFFGQYATLSTNIDPSDSTHGLKDNSSFAVTGLFDLTLPQEDRNEYGIRLTDRTSSQAGDSTVELKVIRDSGGIARVQLREVDFGSHTSTVLQTFNLIPGTNNQILLSLTYAMEQPGVVHASFTLKNGEASTVTNFTATGTIFNNENWTRAQFFADAPAQSDSVLQGTYGQLDITQAGAWTYQLANGQANVQALAAGVTVQDFFTAQVADGHGGFDTQTITVNVTGTNDAPVAVANVAAVTEDALPSTVNGNVLTNDTDVDIGDTHTVSALSGGTDNGTTITKVGTYGTLVITKATGGYTYTLANGQANVQALADGQHVTDVFTYTNADNHGGSSSSTLTVTVTGEDDSPTAEPVEVSVDTASDTNVMVILDRSGSMSSNAGLEDHPTWTRLEAAIEAIKTLLDDYADGGDVRVQIVKFSDVAEQVGSDWMTVEDAKAALAGLSANGSTFYDEALTEAMSLFTQSGKLSGTGVQNVSYFLSDGEPSAQHSVGSGLQQDWEDFLTDNDIVSFALGISNGAPGQENLAPIAFDPAPGDTQLADTPIIVDNLNDLADTLVTTASSASGSLLSGTNSFGADGGYVKSITVDGVTYTFDPAANGGAGGITVTGDGSFISYNGTTKTLTVDTDTGASGGELAMVMTTGAFTFQPTTGFSSESVGFVLVDADGDTASSTLQLTATTLPAGVAGSPINLGLGDPAGHVGPVTVTIAGIPAGWTVNGGADNGHGGWTIPTNNVSALSITSPDHYTGAMAFKVTMNWTNADHSSGSASLTDNVEVFAPGAPIVAWSGDDHLTGSNGKDLFVFAQPIGHDTVYSFDAGEDQIDLIGYAGFTNFNDVQRHLAEDNAGNAVIALGAGQSIALLGVAASALTASNFVFDQAPVLNNAGTMTIGNGALLPLGGVINNAGTIALDSAGSETHLQLIQYGIALHGGGQLMLSDSGQNFISGTSPSVTLTNVDNTISGAGQLGAGHMTLVNDGTIVATGSHALVIDTGANVVTNTGTLEATGSGGLIVNSDVANSGLIWAHGGNITINGAVTGSGSAMIDGTATLGFGAASSVDITFAANAAGMLTLKDAADFTGTISGFSSDDQIDLTNISYSIASAYNASYSSSTNITTLAITDGTSTDAIKLVGNYTINTAWHFSSDGHGGTLLTDTLPGGSADLAQTVTALANPDQFAFQSDDQSGTLAGDLTLAASGQDASTTDAATLDTSAATDNQPTATATAAADTGPASNVTTSQPPTADTTSTSTQAGATTQTASAAPAATGANGDTFVFAANFGHETITNFHLDTDVIEIDHTVFADFQALLAATHDDGNGNAVIAADPNDTITVKNVTVAQLVQHQSDFHFT